MYVRPTLAEDQPTTFGVSGKLWRSALVMYDRQTLSLWSQIDGKVMAGPSVGQTLSELPSQLTTWADWQARHPDTLVLVKPAIDDSPYRSYHERDFVGLPWFKSRDPRLPGKTLVLGIEHRGTTTALAVDPLDDATLLSFQLADEPLLALAPEGTATRLVYVRPKHDGTALEFHWRDGSEGLRLIDTATRSHWDWQLGEAVDGPLRGRRLEPVAVSPIYWGIWSRFYPETEIVMTEIGESEIGATESPRPEAPSS